MTSMATRARAAAKPPTFARLWRSRMSRALGRPLTAGEAAAIMDRGARAQQAYEAGERPVPADLRAAMLWHLLRAELEDRNPLAWEFVRALVGEDLCDDG